MWEAPLFVATVIKLQINGAVNKVLCLFSPLQLQSIRKQQKKQIFLVGYISHFRNVFVLTFTKQFILTRRLCLCLIRAVIRYMYSRL